MDIEEKIKKFQQSCEKLAKNDAEKLDEKINYEIESQIDSELEGYINKQENSYRKQCEKIAKEYNKNLYDFELDCKKSINNVKSIINNSVVEQAEKELVEFTKCDEYLEYLVKNVNETLKYFSGNDVNLYLTDNDFEKYGSYFTQNYNIKILKLDSEYIGGCKAYSKSEGIVIDNTLKSNLEEQRRKEV